MQYSLIFEDKKVASAYSSLLPNQRIFLFVAYLLRQQQLVARFDKVYGETLLPIFVTGLQIALDGTLDDKRKYYSLSEVNIPETNEFAEEEGAYAQNAMIGLYYFLGSELSEEGASIEGSIGMMLENLDLLNYEIDPGYSQDSVVLSELRVVLDMISVIVGSPNLNATLAASLAQNYML